MFDVVFIGSTTAAQSYRAAGIMSYGPEPERSAERIIAERRRCRVMAMSRETLAALPEWLASDLQRGPMPVLEIVPGDTAPADVCGIAARLLGMTRGAAPANA
ncbi:MAG: hypothetical protein KDK10_04960 [Maritimibacter sp.]|nr:hypothetical protein [Maritimibacter sp.]